MTFWQRLNYKLFHRFMGYPPFDPVRQDLMEKFSKFVDLDPKEWWDIERGDKYPKFCAADDQVHQRLGYMKQHLTEVWRSEQ